MGARTENSRRGWCLTLVKLGPMHSYGIARHIRNTRRRTNRRRRIALSGVAADADQRLGGGGVEAVENNRRARFYRLTPAHKQLSVEIGSEKVIRPAIVQSSHRHDRNSFAGLAFYPPPTI